MAFNRHEKPHEVYFFKTPCVVKFPNRDDEFLLCKIGHSIDFEERKHGMAIPFKIELIEKAKFPKLFPAQVCEKFLLYFFYSHHRLRQQKDGNLSEWLGLNIHQRHVIKTNITQFHDPKVNKQFVKDAPVIWDELDAYYHDTVSFAKMYNADLTLEVEKFIVNFDGFEDYEKIYQLQMF